jgi:hypothetical protein
MLFFRPSVLIVNRGLRRYFIDESKLKTLGWIPRVSWKEGLDLTIAWYLQNVNDGTYWPGFERALAPHPSPTISLFPMPEPKDYISQAPAVAKH